MTAEEKLVFQQRYEIKSQSLLRVNLTSSHSGDRVSKGMVFSVQFFDSNGEEIKHNLLNFSHSLNYLNYRYVFTGSAEKHHTEQVTVLPPMCAFFIQMDFVSKCFRPMIRTKSFFNFFKSLPDLDVEEKISSYHI